MTLHPFRSLPRAVPAVAAVVVFSLLCGCTGKPASADGGGGAKGGGGRGGGPGGGNVPVTITTVAQQDVPVEIQVVGNVEAYAAVTVRAQATGELTKVLVKEGDYVKAGDLLFTIDRR